MSTSAFRNIGVVLSAQVNPYVAGMAKASTATRGLTTEITKAETAGKFSFDKVGKAGMVAGGVMLAGFGLAVRGAMNFDATMSEVGAVSGATASELELLSEAAMKAGQATVYSASEAAKAEAELAKAGVSTSDILAGGLTGSLNLAAAGQLDLAKAAEYSANAMNTFGLKGSDVEHISDVLAAAANKSAAEVDDMGMAFAQGGLVAKQMGMGFEETAGTLALFAQNALKGSDAGTSLKTMLIGLTPKSKEAAQLMSQLGIDFTDGQGGFKDMAGVAEELQTKLGGLTEQQRVSALTTIFGTDAIRAAALMYEAGGEGVAEWTKKVNDSGYAAELAAKKNDNLKGDIERLKGAIDTGLIEGGSGATTVLRGMTSGLTATVTGITALPGPLAAAGTGILGVSGAVVGLTGAVAVGLPKYQAMLTTVTEMGPRGAQAAKGIDAVSKAAAAGTIATLGIATAWGIWEQQMAENRAAIDDVMGGIDKRFKADTTEGNVKRLERMRGEIKKLDEDLDRPRWIWDADDVASTMEMREELAKTATAMDAVMAFDQAMAAARGISVEQVREQRVAEAAKNKAIEDGIAPTEESIGQVKRVTISYEDAKSAMTAYYDALNGNTNIEFDLAEAKLKLTEELKENGTAMDWVRGEMNLNTQAGRDNYRQMMEVRDGIIAKGQAEALAAGSTEAGTAKVMSMTEELRNQMMGAGLSKEATDKLILSLGLVPAVVKTSIETSGYNEAIAQAEAVRVGLLGINAGIEAAKRSSPDYMPPFVGVNKKARGGRAWAGQTSLVGEAGPEIVRFNTGAQVYDANTSARMLGGGSVGGGGNHTYHVTVNVPPGMYDEKALADRIGRRLRDQGRGQG